MHHFPHILLDAKKSICNFILYNFWHFNNFRYAKLVEYTTCDSSDDQSDSEDDEVVQKNIKYEDDTNVECIIEPSWNCDDGKTRLIDSPNGNVLDESTRILSETKSSKQWRLICCEKRKN